MYSERLIDNMTLKSSGVTQNLYAQVPEEKVNEIRNLIGFICKKELIIPNQCQVSEEYLNISYNSGNNNNVVKQTSSGVNTSQNKYYGYNIYMYKNGNLEINFDDNNGDKFVRLNYPGLFEEFNGVLIDTIKSLQIRLLDDIITGLLKSTGLNRDINLVGLLDT